MQPQQPQMMVAMPPGAQYVVVNGQPGYLVDEAYCGPITCLIAFFIFPFVCCCPCDRKQEFYAINQPGMQALGMLPPQQMQMQPGQYATQPVYGQPVNGQPQYTTGGSSVYPPQTSYAPK